MDPRVKPKGDTGRRSFGLAGGRQSLDILQLPNFPFFTEGLIMLDPVLTQELTNFVTHLECSITGKRYEAGKVQGLSEAGRPLLVRYDLAALAKSITKLVRVPSQWPLDGWTTIPEGLSMATR